MDVLEAFFPGFRTFEEELAHGVPILGSSVASSLVVAALLSLPAPDLRLFSLYSISSSRAPSHSTEASRKDNSGSGCFLLFGLEFDGFLFLQSPDQLNQPIDQSINHLLNQLSASLPLVWIRLDWVGF